MMEPFVITERDGMFYASRPSWRPTGVEVSATSREAIVREVLNIKANELERAGRLCRQADIEDGIREINGA